jgi:transposase InsO family protein
MHVVIDDHSRYLYLEQHDRENADTNADTLTRAIAHFSELGLRPPQAVVTDNALVYTNSRRFRELLDTVGARHITPPPYTARWNGKAERVIRTIQDEWAYAHTWESSQQRTRALRSFGATTTAGDHTAASETGHPSAAFTTSLVRTARRG